MLRLEEKRVTVVFCASFSDRLPTELPMCCGFRKAVRIPTRTAGCLMGSR